MPKSISIIQNQINNCEEDMQDCLGQCAAAAGEKNCVANFNLKDFVATISSCELEGTLDNLHKLKNIWTSASEL